MDIQLILEVAINPILVWCPRPGCETVCNLTRDASQKRSKKKLFDLFSSKRRQRNYSVVCSACHFSFCSQCKTPWHLDAPCPSLSQQFSDPNKKIHELVIISPIYINPSVPIANYFLFYILLFIRMIPYLCSNETGTSNAVHFVRYELSCLNLFVIVTFVIVAALPCYSKQVPIERDDGCAQMMCKNCRHVFCWFCLASLDDDFMLRHYDSGRLLYLIFSS